MNQDDFIPVSTQLQQLITAEQAWHYNIIPKSVNDKLLAFYADEERWEEVMEEELEALFGKPISIQTHNAAVIRKTLGKYYRREGQGNKQHLHFNADQSEDFVHQLIAEADHIGSSDIHIEVYEERCRIRLRVDGKMMEKFIIPKNEYPALINKLKIKANLDIAEKRLPQDGRIFFNNDGSKFDIRVSVLPTLHGEKIVMRLLSRDATEIDIQQLGFEPQQLHGYLESVKKSHGIVLISGPTGSGKTTTLYATLKVLNNNESNIVTVEDPIEYTLEGINQVQLKEDIGLTFSDALRSFLRQDPDIIMLGEIRDKETAQMAIRAALTGHLVLSTIHTNSAWGTVSRLVDMGVPPYLLAGTLNATLAQRLIRLLCSDCKEEESFNVNRFPSGFVAPRSITRHFKAVGCEQCYYTGYKGRKAVYEVIPIDQELAGQIKNNQFDVNAILQEKKIKRLMDNAFEIFEQGQTSIEEVYSMLMSSY
jgi:type IV pilus assembly protein PilB